MGKPQIVETEIPFCIFVSLGFFRDHLNIFNKKYISLWMESNLFDMQVQKKVKGAAQKNLNTGWLKDFFIPISPLNEQSKISKTFEYYANILLKKDINDQKIIELKSALKSKILDKAIQGKLIKQDFNDESAEILINKILDEKRALIKSKEIKKENLSVIYKNSTDNQFYEKFDDGTIKNVTEEIPFEIPDSWCWTRLENLTTKQIKRGKSPKYTEKSSVYVFSQKCNQKNGKINLENAKFLDETTLKKYNDSDYIMESDIVINSTGNGTLGRVGIIRNKDISSKKIVPDSHITLIRLINEVESNYIFYFLKSNQKYLESQATGSTNQTELSSEIIKKLLIPLSPEKESIMISEKIEKLFNIL